MIPPDVNHVKKRMAMMKREILTAALLSTGLLFAAGLTANAVESGSETRQPDQTQAPTDKPATSQESSTNPAAPQSQKKEETPSTNPMVTTGNSTGAIDEQTTSKLLIPAIDKKAGQPRDYIVVKHDTLWDISANILKNPFKWPEIWKRNPQVTNPNLIHPGDILRLWPNGKVELLGHKESQVIQTTESAKNTKATEATETTERQRPEDMPVVSLEPQEDKIVVLEPQAENGKAVANGAAPKPINKPVAASTAPAVKIFSAAALERRGFVSEKTIKESGAIAASRDGQYYMNNGDMVYISLKDSALMRESFKAGDKFTIFQVGQKMVHPVTEKKLGNLIEIMGSLVITGTDKIIAGKIDRSFKEIPAGARIRPYTETVKEIEITKTVAIIDGIIVGSLDAHDFISAGDVIYIDIGVKSGLKQGNVLDIYKKSTKAVDPFKGDKFLLPPLKVGALIVASVDEETSACIVMQTTNAGINPGDIVRSKPTNE